MTTEVLDIDLADWHPPSDKSKTDATLLILIRWKGTPVGQLLINAHESVSWEDGLFDRLVEAAGWPLRELLLREFIERRFPREEDTMPERVTVAVCTRDRTEDLKNCLDGLTKLPDDGQEIIVIDNCPATEGTARLVQRYPSVRYVREDRPGLDHARNRALREADNPIVAFIDDDAIPDPGWLRGLLKGFLDERVVCVTGLTMPLELRTMAQKWQERHSPFGRGFERKEFDTTWFSPSAAAHAGAGVNMAMRKEACLLLGGFDDALDAGTPTRSGGDTEMYARILASGYRIVYEPSGLVWHRHRRTWSELRRAIFGYGVGVYAAWTASMIRDRQFTFIPIAFAWLKHQIKALLGSLTGRRDALPFDLAVAELAGCAVGPFAYLFSRWRAKHQK